MYNTKDAECTGALQSAVFCAWHLSCIFFGQSASNARFPGRNVFSTVVSKMEMHDSTRISSAVSVSL